MNIEFIVLVVLVIAALWTVLTRSLLRSGIGLALTSAILAGLMFNLKASLAAVFELSVCAGLISVLFISTISLTQPLTPKEAVKHMKDRLTRFWYLPLIMLIIGILVSLIKIEPNVKLSVGQIKNDPQSVLWNLRQVDLIGQIIILLIGVFGVVVFFKERNKDAK